MKELSDSEIRGPQKKKKKMIGKVNNALLIN